MRCRRCGTIFCDDEADERSLGDTRKEFCSENCRHKAAKKRTGALTRQNRARHCRQKMAYRQQWRAEKAVEYLKEKGKNVGAYVCQTCGLWHVTHAVSRRP